ncbi:AAA family ATPase [Brevibacillus fluminis]|uniref:AAA family ATPase n=2 Tax=Brevibacillus fluminis TaxID=511487 RepID=A0A3M8DU34_9BACL|nr:AAA family ATPase [Brevibacillus fluminis]
MKMIQVGVLLSFSGITSVTERSHHRTIYSALYDHSLPQISASVPVELIMRDMQASPVICAAQVRQMAQRGIKIFMGIVTSACLNAIRPILDQYDCLLFCFMPSEEEQPSRQLPQQARGTAATSRSGCTPSVEQHQCSTSLLLAALTDVQAFLPLTWLGYLCGKTYAASLGHTYREFISDVCRHIHTGSDTQAADSSPFPAIQTKSQRYRVELQSARIAAHSATNTLLLGETGVGKEVLARAIHASSMRKHSPFISVNIAALPRELVASELFGYCDGAFTGAKKGGQIGKFEAANGGTLFLDEIGELPLDLQVVLLRVLEERKVTRLGDHDEKPVDVRIIAATNRVLEKEVKSGRFRADLYYRLNVLQIRIPPLRERKEDIVPLAEVLLKQLRAQYGTGPVGISLEAQEAFLSHDWPGNIRELRNVMERAFLLAIHETTISPGHLPNEWIVRDGGGETFRGSVPMLRDMERQTIQQAIAATSSLSAAAKKLGIARSTLYRKMAELEMGQEGLWPAQKQGRGRI